MKLTLLEMVQHILAAMGSDEVNSYDDTVESYQVALLIQQAFYDCAVELGLPEHETMFELNASGTSTKPCIMFLPSNATRMDRMYYDKRDSGDTTSDMQEVKFLPFKEFTSMQNALREETTGVGEQVVTNNGESFNFMYRSDQHPMYYTTMDDNTILFDGFDSSVDTTLQKSKTMCYGSVYPTFTLSNSAYADLDPTQFPYLLAKAKTRAFNELKQTVNQESAAEARKQKIVIQKRKHSVNGADPIDSLPRYGRK